MSARPAGLPDVEDTAEAEARRRDAEDPGRGLLTLTLSGTTFGLWADEVLEILRTPPITRLPLASREIAGVTSVRGQVIPVLDLGCRLLDRPVARPGRLVLVRHTGSGAMVGLLVDGVGTLLGVREDEIRPPPPDAADLPPGWVTGVVDAGDDVVAVLHLGEVAAPPATSTEDGWAE